MGHPHHHHNTGKNILWAFFLNASFAIIEFIGGYLTNSMAIYSDALHDLGDSVALLFSYFAEKVSLKRADRNFTYGYRRFSVLSAIINAFILLSGSLYIIYEAILRLSNPQPVIPEGMLGLAILGIMVNGYAAFSLSKENGLNQRMVMYHLLEDILGWVSVLIVSVVLIFKPLYTLDSILSIIISLVILRGVYKNFVKAAAVFLQMFPSDLDVEHLIRDINKLDIVMDVHAIKGWSIDWDNYYLSLHVILPKTTQLVDIDPIKVSIKKILNQYNVRHSTIEFESTCADT